MDTQKLLLQAPKVINVGLKMFYEDLRSRKVETIHIDWKPAAGGKQNLMDILKKIKS